MRKAEKIRSLIEKLDAEEKLTSNLVTKKVVWEWLNALPLEKHGFWFNKDVDMEPHLQPLDNENPPVQMRKLEKLE